MNTDNQTINEFIYHLTPGKVVDLQLGNSRLVRIKPKIIGMDIQFSNHKESYVPKVKIRPNADSLATMLIVLEKCTLNAKVKNGQKSSLGS